MKGKGHVESIILSHTRFEYFWQSRSKDVFDALSDLLDRHKTIIKFNHTGQKTDGLNSAPFLPRSPSSRPRPLPHPHALAMVSNSSKPLRESPPSRLPPSHPAPSSKLSVSYLLNHPSPTFPTAPLPPGLGLGPTAAHSWSPPAFRRTTNHSPAQEPLPPPPSRTAQSPSPPRHGSSFSSRVGPSAAGSSVASATSSPLFCCTACKRVFKERGNVRHGFGKRIWSPLFPHSIEHTARTIAPARLWLTALVLFLFWFLFCAGKKAEVSCILRLLG